jgi:hypothetical protein
MGRGTNYRRDHAKMRAWSERERRVANNENIMVKSGRGKYPKCLEEKPYDFCPHEDVKDPLNIPNECKTCPHFINSKFYSKKYMTYEKRLEMFKKRGLPLVIGNK